MIVIKVELWSARTGEVKEIGRAYLANVGTSLDAKRADYHVAVCRRGSLDISKATRTGEVKDFPRLSYNIWRLVIRALRSCFPEEK